MMNKDVSLLSGISQKFTKDTLKNILCKVTKCKDKKMIKVSGWKFEPASGKGDNYMSIVHRVTIDGIVDEENIRIKVVIKALPRNQLIKKIFRIPEFFANEFHFYTEVVPRLEKFLESKDQNQFLPIPQCLEAYSDGNNDFIVLEDVEVLGYKRSPRQDTLNFIDIQVILTSFAQFHAVSLAYRDQNPLDFSEAVKNMRETYFSRKHWDWYERILIDVFAAAKDAISKEYADTPEEKEFSTLEPLEFFEKAIRFGHNPMNPSTIITHGDSWPSNIMVRHHENSLKKDAILLDFQVSRCSSPVLDISYFIYTVTDKITRDEYYEDFLKYYHEKLSEYVALLGSNPRKIYPWEQFTKEVKEQSILAFCFALDGLPVLMLEASEAFDTENAKESEVMCVTDIIKIKPIEDPVKRRRYADVIFHAVQQGFI